MIGNQPDIYRASDRLLYEQATINFLFTILHRYTDFRLRQMDVNQYWFIPESGNVISKMCKVDKLLFEGYGIVWLKPFGCYQLTFKESDTSFLRQQYE